jgi:hypothetical protein
MAKAQGHGVRVEKHRQSRMPTEGNSMQRSPHAARHFSDMQHAGLCGVAWLVDHVMIVQLV